ncbi:hypothetical protein SDC9_62737 [bioreactor metagenome]|uniref:Uncharacterized protein n=1 Tax=bioreactor metagenome TaxID=1076179 RepID=A0A644XJT6_9ZZZZ|nr:hypothetical protein [Oscillibacter sp.]MEA4994151.1 hypothetical protein [Oscillibacter sp.]
MYTKIFNTSIVIFDGKTDELIGTATFKLTDESEKALLNLLNYNIQPSSLTLLEVDLYNPSPNYTPPIPYSPYARKGTIYALFTDAYTGNLVPVEIQLNYNARARGNTTGNLYHFESVEFGDIAITSVKIIY